MAFFEKFIALDDDKNEYEVSSNVQYVGIIATGTQPVYDYNIDGVVLQILDRDKKILKIKFSGTVIQDRRTIPCSA